MKEFKLDFKTMKVLPALMMTIFALQISLSFATLDMFTPSYALLAMVLLSFCFASYLILRQRTITQFDACIIAFIMIIAASSVLSGTDVKNWIFNAAAALLILFLFNYYEDKLPPLIVGALVGFSLSVYLGLFDILCHPEKWIVQDSKEVVGYLLGGNYNQIGCRLLCALVTNLFCVRVSKWFILNMVPLVISCVVILLIVQSMTALSSILLFLLICLLPSLRLQRLAIYSLIAAVVVFEVVVCFNGKGFENNELATWFIVDVLNKDITFTYRTDMWDSAVRIIIESPIWGYGFPDADWYMGHMSSFAIGPHNVILAFLIYGGIIAFGLYITMIVMVFMRVVSYHDRTSNMLLASIAVISLMMLFEVYPIMFIFYLFILAFYYGKLNESLMKKGGN